MRHYYLIYLLSFFFVCCKHNSPNKQQIPFEKMKVVVWQLMKADELYTRKSVTDSTWRVSKKNVEFYLQIFQLNKVDRVQFYQQLDALAAQPNDFKILMDSVEQLSKREKNETFEAIKKL